MWKLWKLTSLNLKTNVPIKREEKFLEQDLIYCFAQCISFFYCLVCELDNFV